MYKALAPWLLLLVGAAPMRPENEKSDGLETTLTGKIVVGQHQLKLAEGELYVVKVEGKGFRPHVYANSAELRFQEFMQTTGNLAQEDFQAAAQVVQGFLTPVVSKEHRLAIVPMPYGPPLPTGPLEYKLSVKQIALAKEPLLSKEDALRLDDPPYAGRIPNPHRSYAINVKAGKFYIIEMHRKDDGIDPYLFLEDPQVNDANRKVLAQDDDGAGDLNSRIVYQARKDGELRVVSTSLRRAAGGYTLTIRAQK